MPSKIVLVGAAALMALLVVTNPVVVDAAGQITGKQVKNNSITGKDVKEKSLKDVDATTLGGSPGAAYTNPTYRYVLPVQAPAQARTYQFPGLPPGTYVASYSAVFAVAAIGKAVLCRFDVAGSRELQAYGAPAQFASFSSVSAAGVLTVAAPPTLVCNSQSTPPDNWSVNSEGNIPAVVTFARVDATTVGATTAARVAVGR